VYVCFCPVEITAYEHDLFHHNVHMQIPIKAPGRARGELEITYLDEELR